MPQLDVVKFLNDLAYDLNASGMKPSVLLQGARCLDKDSVLPSLHESGHADMAWSLGHSVLEINLRDAFSEKDGCLQKSTTYRLEPNTPPLKLQADRAMIALAGPLAERLLLPDHSEGFAWDGDLERAIDAIDIIDHSAELSEETSEMLREDAEILIEEKKETIMVLALAAYQFGPVMEGADVEAILNGLTSDEWSKLLEG